uniref:Secreted protein n=1 Tax=Plectus sambesii TaxID=2011161 RepID=A0A914WY81_9BILA
MLIAGGSTAISLCGSSRCLGPAAAESNASAPTTFSSYCYCIVVNDYCRRNNWTVARLGVANSLVNIALASLWRRGSNDDCRRDVPTKRSSTRPCRRLLSLESHLKQRLIHLFTCCVGLGSIFYSGP